MPVLVVSPRDLSPASAIAPFLTLAPFYYSTNLLFYCSTVLLFFAAADFAEVPAGLVHRTAEYQSSLASPRGRKKKRTTSNSGSQIFQKGFSSCYFLFPINPQAYSILILLPLKGGKQVRMPHRYFYSTVEYLEYDEPRGTILDTSAVVYRS